MEKKIKYDNAHNALNIMRVDYSTPTQCEHVCVSILDLKK